MRSVIPRALRRMIAGLLPATALRDFDGHGAAFVPVSYAFQACLTESDHTPVARYTRGDPALWFGLGERIADPRDVNTDAAAAANLRLDGDVLSWAGGDQLPDWVYQAVDVPDPIGYGFARTAGALIAVYHDPFPGMVEPVVHADRNGIIDLFDLDPDRSDEELSAFLRWVWIENADPTANPIAVVQEARRAWWKETKWAPAL